MTDYSEEIAFWAEYLSREDVPALDPALRAGFFPDVIIPCLYHLRANLEGKPHFLDVGAGPISQLAWAVDEDLADVSGVDPLADEYAALLAQNDCTYPVVPSSGLGEDILKIFGSESFDLIYCGNALDHVEDPSICVRNAAEVLKPGGFAVFVSSLREGTHQEWQGLHQHDLVPEKGELWRYDRIGVSMNLTVGLDLECLFQQIEGNRPGDSFTLVYQKGGAVGPGGLDANSPARLIPYWALKHAPSELARTDPGRREQDFPEILVALNRTGWRAGAGPPDVLEVGSGPFSRLAFGSEQGLLRLVAIDPLADLYADLLPRHGYSYPVTPDCCAAENLDVRFASERFDLVYACDVLEYSADPVRSLQNMVGVLRPEGALVLEGRQRRASQLEWLGGQLHDLLHGNGHLRLRDRSGSETTLTRGLTPLSLPSSVAEERYSLAFVRA